MGFDVLAELHGLGFAFDIGALAFVLWVAARNESELVWCVLAE